MTERSISQDPKVEQIVSQYKRVVGAWDEMFAEISKRTQWEGWKQDGIGSCGILKETSETGLRGLARDDLIAMRNEVNAQNDLPRVEGKLSCPLLRAYLGCVLGELKAPICITHIENIDEVQDMFGINHYEFKLEVYRTLRRILGGDEDPDKIKPEENEEFVSQVVEGIRAVIDGIKSVPVDEQPKVKIIPSAPEFA